MAGVATLNPRGGAAVPVNHPLRRAFFCPKTMNDDYSEATKIATSLGFVGLIVGIGQLLASTERLTMRIIVGRALSSAGLGASSSAMLVLIPDLPIAAQLGCAALFASLGTSFIERMFQRWLGR